MDMEIITENLLSRMSGPEFLGLYLLLYMVAVYVARYVLPERIGNRTAGSEPLLPNQPDPYQLAYLRGGATEMLILIVYKLIRQKYISLYRPGVDYALRVSRTDTGGLIQLEKEIYFLLGAGKPLVQFIKDTLQNANFEKQCEQFRDGLIRESLIWTKEDLCDFRRYVDILTGVLITLGVYKLVTALIHGHHNILGIILVSSAGTYLLSKIRIDHRRTAKGNLWLAKLRSIFQAVRGKSLLGETPYSEHLLLGLYGFSILAGSSYQSFYGYVVEGIEADMPGIFDGFDLNISSMDSSSGCSSGCGSGGGCGGGCGGCGGCS